MSNKFNNVRFLKNIEPGDTLELEANLNSFKHGIAKGNVIGMVSGEITCSMECTIIVPDLFGKFQHALPTKEVDKLNFVKSQNRINTFKDKKNTKTSNTNNRPIRYPHLDKLSEAIEKGEWKVTNQGIAFDADGNLIDGQHRLAAILQTRQTVKMMVATNMDAGIFDVVDTVDSVVRRRMKSV